MAFEGHASIDAKAARVAASISRRGALSIWKRSAWFWAHL
jgi:hypothetical protein